MGGCGGGGGSKIDPPFLGVENHRLLVFSILSRKIVSVSRLHGVCMGLVGRALMQFMHFPAIFGMLAVTPWYLV